MLPRAEGVDALAQIDVFSFAGSVTALLLAAGLLIAYGVNRSLTAFRWWAASFGLLAIAMATGTSMALGTAITSWLAPAFSSAAMAPRFISSAISG